MDHADPDQLALSALGELTDASVADHLRGCATCRREVEELRQVVAIGRTVEVDDHPLPPHPQVWQRIQAETVGRSAGAPTTTAPAPVLRPVKAVPRPRRSRVPLVALAAGIVGLLVGLAVARVPALLDDDTTDPAVLARATLAPLPDRSLSGSAQVVRTSSGERALRLQLTGSVPGDGYREVWLLSADAKRLVSLGVVSTGAAQFVLPAGLDLTAFPVVDVSQEHFDGNPGHSADSLSRGTLS